jgi:dihydrofolate reductase
MSSEALLLGRVTYNGFAEAWPSRTGEFADKFNNMPKYVVSSTMDRADWNNSTLIRDNVPEAVARIKQELSGDILVNGSRRLVQTLVQHDLVDEYRLMVYPVVLGGGKRLFGDQGQPTPLRLVQSTPSADVLILTYEPARNGAS